MKRYKINEIFFSLQGEGAFTGTPCTFIRFSGCNMKCWFCDTEFDSFYLLSRDEIYGSLPLFHRDAPIILTGGEPMLQLQEPEDVDLVKLLSSNRRRIHIETNGTIEIPDTLRRNVDWVTVSPKLYTNKPVKVKKAEELKVIWSGESASDILHQLLAKGIDYRRFDHLYLQPNSMFFNVKKASMEEQQCKTKELTSVLTELNIECYPKMWKLSLQIHKILNIK